MEKSEVDKKLDEYLEKANKNIGETRDHKGKLGPYPINILDYYGQQHNEWVTTDSIRHFACGFGDRNPLWWNEDYAKKTKWGGIIAPPTFIDFIAAPYTCRKIPTPLEWGLVGLPAGPSRKMFKEIRPGDRIQVFDKWLGVKERKVKDERYRFFISSEERTYKNQKDEIVAIVIANWGILATYAPAPTMGTLFAGSDLRKRHRLTDEERDAIVRGYDEETRRGSDKLSWEDVAVGEEVNLHSVGPLTAWDTAAFLEAIPGRAIAFDTEWERIKTDFNFSWLDPELNAWMTGGEGHLRDGGGHSKMITGGAPFGFGGQQEGLISRAICNWMGDDGFVKRMDSQFRAPVVWGDVITTKGKVTNKSVEGGEHLVDLELHCENHNGLVLTKSSATVVLSP